MLALAAVRRELDHLAIAAMKRLVYIHHRLHRVVARRHIPDRSDRVAGGAIVYRYRLARLQAVNRHTENHL